MILPSRDFVPAHSISGRNADKDAEAHGHGGDDAAVPQGSKELLIPDIQQPRLNGEPMGKVR